MKKEEIEKTTKAGKIHREVSEFARGIVRKNVKLLEIAEKIDKKIDELGAKPAFPVNLSMNEVAAHCTPAWNDEGTAQGLLKVDIGIQIDGYVADGAFTVDLENTDENKKLIEAAEAGLSAALAKFHLGTKLGEVGAAVQKEINKFGFVPIKNLTGHKIEQYDLHSGVSVPNFDSAQEDEIEEGVYAIEPFSTNGFGRVRDGKPSGIYKLSGDGNVRDNFAREVLHFIAEEYGALPFCARWIHKKFGTRGLLALRMIEQTGIIYQYPQLVEDGHGKVAQAEHTVILHGKERTITTK